MNVKIEDTWKNLLGDEFSKDYFIELTEFLKDEYASNVIYPPGPLIFNAFNQTPVHKVKVVILGQDPYHGQGQAHGLSFSVNEGVPFPPSLLNIFKELKSDIGKEIPINGNLEYLAKQGVLLLNATLTVRSKSPGSHQNRGWEEFTDAAITRLAKNNKNLVFILWGAYAQKKGALIPKEEHYIIKTPHPSPFSAHKGFFGSRPFSKCNAYLNSKGISEIDW